MADDVVTRSGEIISHAEFVRRREARRDALIALVIDEMCVVDEETSPEELRMIAHSIIALVRNFDRGPGRIG